MARRDGRRDPDILSFCRWKDTDKLVCRLECDCVFVWAAGSLLSVLLWVYYSSAVFLLGAEFTRAYAVVHGSRADLAQMVALGPVATGSTASTDEASTKFAQGQSRSRTFWLAPLTAALVTGFLLGILARL